MANATITAHVAGTVLTATALNNNFNAIINQLNGNIEAINLANLAVTTAKINTDAVTFDKLDDDGNFGPFTGTWEFDGTVNFDGPVDFDSTVDLSGATLLGATPLVFEGATDNAFETALAITDPTADRTLTVPDEDVSLGQQVIKAWATVDLSSGTPTLQDSFNVTSLTDNGAGLMTANWTTPFASANYAIAGSVRRSAGEGGYLACKQGTALTTGAAALSVNDNNGGGREDAPYACFMAIGDR